MSKLAFYSIVAAVVICFDVAGAFASRSFQIDYTSLGWISWLIYVISGYFGFKFFGITGGILAGFVSGLADSTVGWALSSLIGPYVSFEQPEYTPQLIIEIVMVVTAMAVILGLIGAMICWLMQKATRE